MSRYIDLETTAKTFRSMTESTEASKLYALGRLRGHENICYANASFQCLCSWEPFMRIIGSDSSSPNQASSSKCVLKRLRLLVSQFRYAAVTNGNVDVLPFMEWMFTLKNMTLRRGVMEDPHDFLMVLWEKLSMAGGPNVDKYRAYAIISRYRISRTFRSLKV